MVQAALTDSQLREALELVERCGSITKAAKHSGMNRRTLSYRYNIARASYRDDVEATVPDFPDIDLPVEEIIERQCRTFEAKRDNHESKQWFDVGMSRDEPVIIAFIGDPHVDDDGCNWPLLKRDMDILASTPNCFAVNIGDTTNNWCGKLLAKYADQSTTKRAGYKLARWLMQDSGVNWLMWLLGNHDTWSDGAYVMAEMAQNCQHKVFDWYAKFQLSFPNGRKCPIWAAHSFKGNSIYNPGHGMMRAARMGQVPVRLFVQGHHHEYFVHHSVYEDLDLTYWGAKARGYKAIDTYADKLQFGSNSYGATVCAVIDPRKPENHPGFIRVIDDLETAVTYLKMLRAG